ncbi:MAG: helix-hairpin-helix domain-containing protein [Burkholderiaceae bacterium]|nr:helix-hairpin-helix domain-containing protein [Burkholderiaceae bacterium]
MLKKLLVLLAMLYAAASFAAVEVNKANAAELDSIKGIGPALSGRILDERKKGNFKDWADFMNRVNGVGKVSAGKFSAEGLTVNGQPLAPAASAPDAAKKAEPAKAGAAKPASPAAEPKKEAAATPATPPATAPAALAPAAPKK